MSSTARSRRRARRFGARRPRRAPPASSEPRASTTARGSTAFCSSSPAEARSFTRLNNLRAKAVCDGQGRRERELRRRRPPLLRSVRQVTLRAASRLRRRLRGGADRARGQGAARRGAPIRPGLSRTTPRARVHRSIRRACRRTGRAGVGVSVSGRRRWSSSRANGSMTLWIGGGSRRAARTTGGGVPRLRSTTSRAKARRTRCTSQCSRAWRRTWAREHSPNKICYCAVRAYD